MTVDPALIVLWTDARRPAGSSVSVAFLGSCGRPPCEVPVFHTHLVCPGCWTIGQADCRVCRSTAWADLSYRHDAFLGTANVWRWRRN